MGFFYIEKIQYYSMRRRNDHFDFNSPASCLHQRLSLCQLSVLQPVSIPAPHPNFFGLRRPSPRSCAARAHFLTSLIYIASSQFFPPPGPQQTPQLCLPPPNPCHSEKEFQLSVRFLYKAQKNIYSYSACMDLSF
jgi:hypothetical protein